MKLGIEKTAMVRVRAGISYALTEAMDEGHCGLPTEELIPLAEKLLEVPQELIRTALELELQEGTVVATPQFPAGTVGTLGHITPLSQNNSQSSEDVGPNVGTSGTVGTRGVGTGPWSSLAGLALGVLRS
jgi:hypothetical protein